MGGKDGAQGEGVKGLIQIPVEQAEGRAADEDSRAVPEDTDSVQQQAAENEFLRHRRYHGEGQHRGQRRQSGLDIGHHVGGGLAQEPLQQGDQGNGAVGEQVTGPRENIRARNPSCPLRAASGMGSAGGCPAAAGG